MGKNRSWFSFVKKLFITEAESKAEKKSKRWRWVSGRLKFKQYPALPAPHITLSEAREEHSKRAFAAAIATAAAADAAVAAVHAAAEVVRLTGFPQSYHECDKRIQNLAAIKIQTAYRAYLARKALRALKGLVRIQAIARGQIARNQVIPKSKCLASIVKTESQVHKLKVRNVHERCKDGEKKQLRSPKKLEKKETKLEQKSPRNWDYSFSAKEDMEILRSRKQEAIIKRERMKKYSSSSQERNDQTPRESTSSKENGRQGLHLEQKGDAGAYKRRDTEKLKSTVQTNLIAGDNYGAQIKIRNVHKHDSGEELNSPFSLPRRSYCSPKRWSTGNDKSLPISPVFPTYMAATESVKAKAKARSISAPKQRLGFLDSCSDHNSPCKLRFSPWSSLNGEVIGTDRKSIESTSQRMTIRMK